MSLRFWRSPYESANALEMIARRSFHNGFRKIYLPFWTAKAHSHSSQ